MTKPNEAEKMFQPYPCGICGKILTLTGGGCRECTLKITALPHPGQMTPDQRRSEVGSYRPYPRGISIQIIARRIQELIGLRFNKGEGLPNWFNDDAWEKLAQQAKEAYP